MRWKLFNLPKFSMSRLAWRPDRNTARKMTWAGLLAAAMVGAFYLGRQGGFGEVRGQSPQQQVSLDPAVLQKAAAADRARSVVAYIYGNIPVTRQELGEYLIDRYGAERLDYLVNRKIIERACEAMNIHVTDAEINAQLAEDCRSFGCTEVEFAIKILKPRNKTLYEWREDVIRPKLALQRVVKDRIVITEADIQNAFEAKYGPKVECRIIVLTKEQAKDKDAKWKEASASFADFERCAKNQAIPQFAAEAGKIPPIHMHFPDHNVEEAAFKLKEGETSPLIHMPDQTIVFLHCVKRIPADTTKTIAQERLVLNREVFETRLPDFIRTEFNNMRKAADPKLFLKMEYTLPDAAMLASQPPSGQ